MIVHGSIVGFFNDGEFLMKHLTLPERMTILRLSAFLITLILLFTTVIPCAAQEKKVIPIYILVPGMNDNGRALINLAARWAYPPDIEPAPLWTVRTDRPGVINVAMLRSQLESGVRLINLDMKLDHFLSLDLEERWLYQTGQANNLLQILTRKIQVLNQESRLITYQVIVLAHSAGTNVVASSWQDGAVYDKAILFSPRFRVNIMANLARAGGMNASTLLVVTARGDFLRSVLQPEPVVYPENLFFTQSSDDYDDSAFNGESFTHLEIVDFETPLYLNIHGDMVVRAHSDLAWIDGVDKPVILATVYQHFIQNGETGIAAKRRLPAPSLLEIGESIWESPLPAPFDKLDCILFCP